MSAYRRVYDSRHLQADCQESESAHARYSSSLWATFTFFLPLYSLSSKTIHALSISTHSLGLLAFPKETLHVQNCLAFTDSANQFSIFENIYSLSTRNLRGSLNTVLFRMTYLLFQSPPTLLRSFS